MHCFTQASSSFNVFKIKGQVFPHMEISDHCVFNILHKLNSCSRTFATQHLMKQLIIEPEAFLLPKQCRGTALARGRQRCEQQPEGHPSRGGHRGAALPHCSHCWCSAAPPCRGFRISSLLHGRNYVILFPAGVIMR